MALAGHIHDFPLAELLFFLSNKQRTGMLVLKRAEMTIIFTLRRGRLIAAQMIPADQRLGDRLVADGALMADALHEALQFQQQHASDRPFGTLLVERGYLAREEVHRAIRGQIADCLVAFLVEPGGIFTFRECEVDPSRLEVDVNVEREVLEAISRADEHVARQIETGPLRLKPNVGARSLQPFILENWDVIDAMLGGAQTIEEIVSETAWDRDSVVNALFQLQANGVIDLECPLLASVNGSVP